MDQTKLVISYTTTCNRDLNVIESFWLASDEFQFITDSSIN